MKAFEDPAHIGNSSKYHTGKKCRTEGCDKPAGTLWSPLRCFDCNVQLMRHLSELGRAREALHKKAPVFAERLARIFEAKGLKWEDERGKYVPDANRILDILLDMIDGLRCMPWVDSLGLLNRGINVQIRRDGGPIKAWMSFNDIVEHCL